jgi:hypothetical protein
VLFNIEILLHTVHFTGRYVAQEMYSNGMGIAGRVQIGTFPLARELIFFGAETSSNWKEGHS